tara:strand:+ start:1411 stop:3156 length:1746 start_codon:yes stop_codon:yes gene_type:complete
MSSFVAPCLAIRALRNSGYKSTAHALAELVDNSIEAEAKNIEIVTRSIVSAGERRNIRKVSQITTLDDGNGMTEIELQNCLSFGWGTHLDNHDDLGRFGWGLKGASISQGLRTEVYSWQEPDDYKMTYLDINEICDNEDNTIPEITRKKPPAEILKLIEDKNMSSGTAVVWQELDKIDLSKPTTLYQRLDRSLCRIYRHFLDDDDNYGTKRFITLHGLKGDEIDGEPDFEPVQLKANDPLYLLTPNTLPGYEDEATNEEFENFKVDFNYHNITNQAEVRTSICKPEIQELGGNSEVGQHYGRNTGISILRVGREIDLRNFDFLDNSNPQHRWWGMEIRFTPGLDEVFGLTNNKQKIENFKNVAKDIAIQDEYRELSAEGDDFERAKAQFYMELSQRVREQITKLFDTIRARRKGSRGSEKRSSGIVSRVNEELKGNTSPTASEIDMQNKTNEEKILEKKKLLLKDNTSLDEKEAEKLARKTLSYRIDIAEKDWGGSMFLDRETVGNAATAVINRRHLFFSHFYDQLGSMDDVKGFEALQTVLMGFVRAEDEMARELNPQDLEMLRNKWGEWVHKFITHAGN